MSEIDLRSWAHTLQDQKRIEEERESLTESYLDFVREAWHILKPHEPFIHNWHLDAVASHLEAVSRGEIHRLQIWIPPGAMKTLLVSVFWHPWEWTTRPWLRYWTASYEINLAGRFALDAQRVITDKWYQDRWGDQFHLLTDAAQHYKNNQGGDRLSTTPGSTVGTGVHGHRILLDDPIPAKAGEIGGVTVDLKTKLQQANDWWDGTVSSRGLDNADEGFHHARILVMQRLHECLPPDARVRTPRGSTPISLLSAGDEVLTSLGVERVVSVVSRPHRGDVFEIRCYGHSEPFVATGNHRVLTADGWVPAEELTVGHSMVVPVPAGETCLDDLRGLWPEETRTLKITARQGSFTGSRKVLPEEPLRSLAAQGLSVAQMSEQLGYRSRGTVHNALMYHGIERPAARAIEFTIVEDPEFWWLVGLWLAEGSVSRSRKKDFSHVRWTVGRSEDAFVEKLRRVLEKYGSSVSVAEGPGVYQVSCFSRQLAEFLMLFGSGAREKFLPEWCVLLPLELLKNLFLGYWQGDGCLSQMNGRKRVRCGSSSLDLLEGWQRALLRLGVVSSIMAGNPSPRAGEIREGNSFTSNKSWELRFPLSDAEWLTGETDEPPVRSKMKLHGDWLEVPIKSITKSPYDAEVWDIETPSHDFLTGIVTAHNSDPAAHMLDQEEWTVLCLPERYWEHPYAWRGDNIHPKVKLPKELMYGDPRKEEELLWPARRDEVASNVMARRLGWRASGQLQQWPVAREGVLLKLDWWRFYDPRFRGDASKLPKFGTIVISVDTPLKDKESSDNVAIQCWGVHGGDRYLLDLDMGRMNFGKAKRRITEMARWARKTWPGAYQTVLIENAGYGVELIVDLKRDLGNVQKISPAQEGDKISRAEAASDALESGNCFLPGYGPPWQPAYDEAKSPAEVVAFVQSATAFPFATHDDDVDAWSQAMNWLRSRNASPVRTSQAWKKRLVRR